MTLAEAFSRRMGGRRDGATWRARCPGCGAPSGLLLYTDTTGLPGAYCAAGGHDGAAHGVLLLTFTAALAAAKRDVLPGGRA